MFRTPIAASALTLGLVTASLTLGCAPAPSVSGAGEKGSEGAKPEDTCKHVREIADKDSDDAAALDQVERECVETLAAMKVRYETLTTCVNLAGDAKAIAVCEQGIEKPRPLLAASGPLAKVEAVCSHVLSMLEKQLTAAGNSMQPEELAKLQATCVEDAATQLELKGAEAFDQEAECILAAQNIEALQACGV